MSEIQSMNENAKKIGLLVESFNMEFRQLLGGKKASANRSRKLLLELKNLSHALRKEIIEYVKTLPKKKVAPPSSSFKKATEVKPIVDETKVEDVKEPEPVQESVKPKRVRKTVVKKIITNQSAEQQLVTAAKKE